MSFLNDYHYKNVCLKLKGFLCLIIFYVFVTIKPNIKGKRTQQR